MNKKSFHLRWNNHLQNLQSLFENLYNEQSLVDVTISCSDGLLYGHKLVLSACSPYFEQVFKDNPCKHPILILKGINAREMQIILQYMYVGAVDVGEDELELLLDTATELQVKGLVQNSSDSPQPPSEQKSNQKANKTHKESYISSDTVSPNPHHNGDDLRWQAELVAKPSLNKNTETDSSKRYSEIGHPLEENADSFNKMQMKLDTVLLNEDVKGGVQRIDEYQDPDEEGVPEYLQTAENLEESQEDMQISFDTSEINKIESDDTVYFCHICIRNFQSKGSYHRHMLTHAGVKPHSCTFCNQAFLRLSHLQRHIRVHTGERPYQCTRCPKQFARSDKLRQHYILQHNDEAIARVPKPRGRPRKNPNNYGPPMGNLDSIVYPVMAGISPALSISPISPVPAAPVTNPV